MKAAFLTIIGLIALLLGLIGAALPIFPTTPFVLVAAACFAGGNPRLYRWLCKSKYFGQFIENYRCKTGIEVRTKRVALCFLWTTLTVSAVVFSGVWWILLIVGIAVSVHILMIKNKVAQ